MFRACWTKEGTYMLYIISPAYLTMIYFLFARNSIILTDGMPEIICLEPMKEE
jgi:hypothetical protein